MGWAFSEDIELTKFGDWVFPGIHDLLLLIIPGQQPDEKLETRLNQIQDRMKYNLCWLDADEFQFHLGWMDRNSLICDRIVSECKLPNFFFPKAMRKTASQYYKKHKAKQDK